MHIIGTAGHVDHGKSSLVQALTGVNPDRWVEEQLRGMTLDLGFARLRFEDGMEAGIIDVPGHERFLHNMLAGAAGMELLLLVIAANEGPKPQTYEHLSILNYLNVRRALIVLTKSDTVDAEELEMASELAREAVGGTFAQDAPILATSTHTGLGLPELRAAIRVELAALPQRKIEAPVYLPVDRVFALAGHGTIVTGTLMQGRIRVGDALVLQPSGRQVRIRSLGVFGEKREAVEAGARVAANLPGVDTTDIARGEVLAAPEFAPEATLQVSFVPLPAGLALVRRRTPVRVYIGSAEVLGTLLCSQPALANEAQTATLFLKHPVAVYPGAAYVVRRLSPKVLLGGGTIAGAAVATDLAGEENSDVAAVSAALANSAQPLGVAQLCAAANLRQDRVEAALELLAGEGRALPLAKPLAYLDGAQAERLFDAITALFADNERAAPWSMGITSLQIARTLKLSEPLVVRVLAAFAEAGRLRNRGGYYATLEHTPALSAAQRAFFDDNVKIVADQPYLPASLTALTSLIRVSKIAGLAQAFDTLVASGALVKIGDDLYRNTQLAEIRSRMETAIRTDGSLSMSRFRDLVGTSRKYAVPLLEWFDLTGVTLRSGDLRVLRTKAPAEAQA